MNANKMKNAKGSASFDCGGGPISAVSSSPDWKFVVVGGRDVMKILSLEKTDGFSEAKNLRRGHKGSVLMMSANDVDWSHVAKNLIASAASTSAVVIWDVEAERKTDRRKALQSHHRAANSVCWHNVPSCLLSASQDGSIHYWDLRVPDVPAILFNPRSEAVREVDFNPYYGNYFAGAFDDGTVQAWDIRKPNACERRITAHDGLVLSVAWHPQDSSILASGGRDGTVKVWDLNVANRPRYQIQTIAAVGKVSWRPKCTYQICSSAAVIDFSVQIWDLHRPTVPLATLGGHRDVVTGMVWPHESAQSLITASKDGTLAQMRVRNAEFPSQRMPSSPFCWNRSLHRGGEIALVVQRPNRANPEDASTHAATASSDSSAFAAGVLLPSPFVISREKIGLATLSGSALPDGTSFERLASSYRMEGGTTRELCEFNASVARLAKPSVCPIWEIAKVMLDGGDDEIAMEHRKASVAANVFIPPLAPMHAITVESPPEEKSHTSVRRGLAFDGEPVQNGGAPNADGLFSDSDDDALASKVNAGNNDDDDDDDPFRENSPLAQPLDLNALRKATAGSSSKTNGTSATSVGGGNGLGGGGGGALSAIESLPLAEHISLSLVAPVPFTPTKSAPWRSAETVVRSAEADDWGRSVPWDPLRALEGLFTSLLDAGDVQTAFHLAMVVGVSRLAARTSITDRTVKRWCVHYLDLLSSMQLWSVRNRIIRSVPWEDVRDLGKKGTTFHANCPSCNMALSPDSWYCKNCKKVAAMCAVCHLVVKGLLSWCQTCGHSGHARCITQWWRSGAKLCPDPSCTHRC
jgi:WD40 repeat protein